MKILLIQLSLYFITFHAFGQYFGGSGEGFQVNCSGIVTFNNQDIYCTGAESDGFAFSRINGFFYTPALVFSGGNSDGFVFNSDKTTINRQITYCLGGNGDGNDRFCTREMINDFQNYYFGGVGDGMNLAEAVNTINLHTLYCAGGSGDGSDLMNTAGYVFGEPFFCYGANGNGFDISNPMFATINNQQDYCSGESGDGSSNLSFYGQVSPTSIFTGGQGDGECRQAKTSLVLGYGIWTGNTSSNWEFAGNWKYNLVPDSSINVFIPSYCKHYPRLTNSLSINSDQGYYQCRRLDIDTIGFLDINSSLYINGIVNVYGAFTSTNQDTAASQIGPQGKIFIRSNGLARFGVK